MRLSNPLINKLSDQLCEGATVVTANKRLAREFRKQFNLLQLQQAKRAWESADILPFEAWVFSLWQRIRARYPESGTMPSHASHGSRDGVVLSALQSKVLWQQIIGEDISRNERNTQPLWNIAATVKAAMAAWRVLQEWDISIADCEKSLLPDHRCFSRWAREFQKLCDDNHWIDSQQLINAIIEGIDDGHRVNISPLHWVGFDGFTAQQQRLIETLRNSGVSVSIQRSVANDEMPHHQCREYDSEYSQWLAAAHWAKNKIDNNPNHKIAIVAPALDSSRETIDYALSQLFSPNHVVNPDTMNEKPFHISLGIKLSDFPVIEAAVLLLSLITRKDLDYSIISKFILNPFIDGADSESYARSKLEYWCRRRLPYRIRLQHFLGFLEKSETPPPTPVLFEKLRRCREMIDLIDSTHGFASWPELLLTWLELFGWPGERTLSSVEFQTVEVFKQEVATLGSLDLIAAPSSVAAVLGILTQRLSEKPFEPESMEVNVELLGVLESAGLEFDAIWFGGLIERDWPPPLQQNPFIPHWLQHDANYYGASVSLNAERAKAQQMRLANQAGEIVLSRHCFEEDVALFASELFGQNAASDQPGPSLIDYIHNQKPPLEIFTGTTGLALSDGMARGGTSVIQDQAACPFRAYARHRLGARHESPREPGLDARDRGSLIHGILQGVWLSIGSSKNLNAKPDEELSNIVSDNITQHSKQYFYVSGSNRQFFRVQSETLQQLIIDWLDVEKSRAQGFVVLALEKQQQVTLGKLTLSFKIDRIDELGDNTLALIDYKTGDVGSIREWMGERPKSPQLPLYALAQQSNSHLKQNPLSTIVFGQVRFGQSTYFGVSRDQRFQIAKHPANRVTVLGDMRVEEDIKDWSALLGHWTENLTKVADAYCEGHAVVNPLDKSTCTYCELHGLCRIYEAGKNDG